MQVGKMNLLVASLDLNFPLLRIITEALYPTRPGGGVTGGISCITRTKTSSKKNNVGGRNDPTFMEGIIKTEI